MNENGVKLVCFQVCGDTFAFNMEYLVEIIQVHRDEIIPFFSRIPLLRGSWNYRGKTAYLIDIRDFFGLEDSRGETAQPSVPDDEHEFLEDQRPMPETAHALSTILIVKIRSRMFGLFTDAVFQVVPLASFYEYPTMLSTLPRRYFAGVAVVKDELVLLLALEELINEYEFETMLSRVGDAEDKAHVLTD